MSFVMFATWLLVGALAGVVAGLVVKRAGHGLKTDIFLGLAGSIGGNWIFRGLVHSGGGMLAGVELAYITSPYREETVHFPATIGRP